MLQSIGTPGNLADLSLAIHAQISTSGKFRKFQRMYAKDRVAFAYDMLGALGKRLAFYQEEILGYYDEGYTRVAVRGPHGLGKTFMAALLTHHSVLTAEADAKTITTASAWRQLEKYLWPEIRKLAGHLDWALIGREPYDPNKEFLSLAIRLSSGTVEAFAVASDDHNTIEGAHARRLTYIFDEAKAIPRVTWDAAEGAFSNAKNIKMAIEDTEGDPNIDRWEALKDGSKYAGKMAITRLPFNGGIKGKVVVEAVQLNPAPSIATNASGLAVVKNLIGGPFSEIVSNSVKGVDSVREASIRDRVKSGRITDGAAAISLGMSGMGIRDGLESMGEGVGISVDQGVEFGMGDNLGEGVGDGLGEGVASKVGDNVGFAPHHPSQPEPSSPRTSGVLHRVHTSQRPRESSNPRATSISQQPIGTQGTRASHTNPLPSKTQQPREVDGTMGSNQEASVHDGTTDEAFAFAISTPGDPSGQFYDIHSHKPGYEDWKTRHVTVDEAIKAGRISSEWVRQRERQWGASSSIFLNRVLGEFADSSEEGVIPLSWIRAATERWKAWHANGRTPQSGKRALGVDVARAGVDKTVCARRQRLVISDMYYFSKLPITSLAGYVKSLSRGYELHIETDGGLGASLYDILHESNVPLLRPITVSGGTTWVDRSKELRFLNVRAAMWWNMRELLDPEYGSEVMLPPVEELVLDLSTPKYEMQKDAVIKLESKNDISERLGRSTDYGDSVCLAFWDNSSMGGGMVF
jgi:hypothetical protein